MRALTFLWVRSFVNGLKRNLGSPKRLITLVVFLAYYFFAFIRPFGMGRPQRLPAGAFGPTSGIRLPDPAVLDPFVFTIFAFLTLILAAGVMAPRGGFKPADVDVLFPTPVSPRLVLGFRIVRDYVFTLLLPLFFAVLGWRGTVAGFEAMFRNFPGHAVYVFRAASAAWILMALCWVCISYAASLFVGRSDLQSDRNRKIIGWGVFFAVCSVLLFATLRFRADPSMETFREIAGAPLPRAVFFTGTAATALVMAPITGSLVSGLLGFFGLLAIIAVSLRIALTQVGWMYDQAAVRGFSAQESVDLQRKGDMYGLLAERARQGKLKTGRIARLISRIRPTGARALLWKDMVLQARGQLWALFIFGPMVLGFIALSLYGVSRRGSLPAIGATYLVVQTFGVFMIGSSLAQSGFIELLRRVDVQKPLPFTPGVTVFWEVAAKMVVAWVVTIAGAILATIMVPALWAFALASVLLVPAYGIMLVAVVCLTSLLFSDMDDPTQRGFRGLMTLLGFAIVSVPSVPPIAGALFLLKLHPLIVAVPGAALCLAISAGICAIAGNLYAGYNPSE